MADTEELTPGQFRERSHLLFLALRKLNQQAPKVTLAWREEVRHTLLYVSQSATSARTRMASPDVTTLETAVELEDLSTKLRILRDNICPEAAPPDTELLPYLGWPVCINYDGLFECDQPLPPQADSPYPVCWAVLSEATAPTSTGMTPRQVLEAIKKHAEAVEHGSRSQAE